VLSEAAARLGGRASPGTRFDRPQLRATVDGVSVTLSIKDAYRKSEKGTAVAEAPLADEARTLRLYFGWDVADIREEILQLSEIGVKSMRILGGKVIVRGDDAKLAAGFLEHAALDLAGIRREAKAHALEILARGGTFRIAVHGIQRSTWMIEHIVTATARLVRGLEFFAGVPARELEGPPPPRVSTPPFRDDGARFEAASCALCTENRSAHEGWVRCNRCHAPYHERYWVQATGCLAEGCAETRGAPM